MPQRFVAAQRRFACGGTATGFEEVGRLPWNPETLCKRESWAADMNVNHKGVFPMRKYLLAAAATVAIAAPAAAKDNSGYVGVEGGIIFPRSQTVFGTINFTTPGTPGPVDV